MAWQVLILISIFFGSVCTLLQRVLLKDDVSYEKTYSVFFQLLSGLIIGGFGLFFADMSFPSDLRPLAIGFILMIVLYGFGNIFVFKALKKMEASRFTIIFSSKVFFTVFASSWLLGEVLTLKQIIGTVLIIVGILLVNIKSAKLAFSKNEIIAVLAAASFGFGVSNDSFMLRTFNLYPYVCLAFVVPALFIMALNPYTIKNMKVFLKKDIMIKMLLLCFLYAIQAILFFTALQMSKNSSRIASINLVGVITTVLMAIVFLKEKDNLAQKLLGTVSSFIGLLLMT